MNKKIIMFILIFIALITLSSCAIIKPKHTHNFVKKVTAPTCTEQGFTTNICECGESYIDNYVSAIGHSFTNYLSDNNATETEDGTKTALCNNPGCNEKDTVIDVGSVLGQSYLSFNSLTVQGNNVYGTVSNATEVFEFANEITAGKTCEYFVGLDKFGIHTSLTKAVPLAIGDNIFYIFEIIDGAPKSTFVVTIRRKPIYTVTFNSNGGTPIQSQTVEEGYLASTPTEQITKLGYTFSGWDFDFTAPITQSITIDAKFEVKPEMVNFNFTSNFSTCKITGLKDKSVTQVVIPDYVTFIGDSAFRDCCKLVEVINKSRHITVTKGSTSNGYVGYYALSVSNRDNTYVSKLTKDNDYIIYTDGAEKVLVGYIGTETASTLPSYITKINQYAFWYCDSLTSVVIGDSVTFIGDQAFAGCSSLTSIIVSEDNENFKDIDGNLYAKDGKTLLQYAIGKKDTSFTVPNSVETIGDYAFSKCDSLTSVVIGESVRVISAGAFDGCLNLKNAYYMGSEKSWSEVLVDYSGNSVLYSIITYYGMEDIVSLTFEITTAVEVPAWCGVFLAGTLSAWGPADGYELTRIDDTHFKGTFTFDFSEIGDVDRNAEYKFILASKADNGDGTYTYGADTGWEKVNGSNVDNRKVYVGYDKTIEVHGVVFQSVPYNPFKPDITNHINITLVFTAPVEHAVHLIGPFCSWDLAASPAFTTSDNLTFNLSVEHVGKADTFECKINNGTWDWYYGSKDGITWTLFGDNYMLPLTGDVDANNEREVNVTWKINNGTVYTNNVTINVTFTNEVAHAVYLVGGVNGWSNGNADWKFATSDNKTFTITFTYVSKDESVEVKITDGDWDAPFNYGMDDEGNWLENSNKNFVLSLEGTVDGTIRISVHNFIINN